MVFGANVKIEGDGQRRIRGVKGSYSNNFGNFLYFMAHGATGSTFQTDHLYKFSIDLLALNYVPVAPLRRAKMKASDVAVLGAIVFGIAFFTYLDYIIPSFAVTVFLSIFIALFATCLFHVVTGSDVFMDASWFIIIFGIPIGLVLSFYPHIFDMAFMALAWAFLYTPFFAIKGSREEEDKDDSTP